MNTRSAEQQLQQLNPPAPDAAARLRAKRAALAEFKRIHAVEERQSAPIWSWRSPWVGSFATAGIAVIGVSLFWLAPENERAIQLPAQVETPRESAAIPPVVLDMVVPEEPAPAPTIAPVATPARTSARKEGAAATPPSTTLQRADVVSGGAVAAPAIQVAAAPPPPPGPPAPPVFGPPAPPAPPALPVSAGSAQDRGSVFIANTIANLRGVDPAFGSRTLTVIDGRRAVSSEADEGLSQVQVTGTRIQAPGGYTSANPITTITGEEMRQLGIVNVADSLMKLVPQNVSTSTPGVAGQPGGDRFERFEINPVKRVADEPESTFSIDVDTASYSYTRRILNQGQLPGADVVRVEEMINYFDYAWPAPTSAKEPLRPTVVVSDSPWGSGKKLVHIGIRSYELPTRGKPDSNLVFLLDVSGSMSSQDRLPLAIQSMKLLLDSLKPSDTVGIVVYAGAAGQVLPPTPVRNRAAIENALNSLHSGGSTAGAQGIQLAYQLAEQGFRKEGVNRILLATDGDFNVGMSTPNELKNLVERERNRGIYLSVLGFGQGNYRDEVSQTLAQNGNGIAAYIDTLQEARKVLVEEASSTLFTVASDVKIQVEFNPATVAEYRLVGYETRSLKREDFNNDKVDAGDVGSGHAVTAIYEITPVGSNAQLLDERRYSADGKPASTQGKSNEYGFLKIRYKLPGERSSRLMQQPIQQNAAVPAALRREIAFSTAVAGFGQLLRGSKYTGPLGYDDVIREAEAGLGEDEYGYRAEFVKLARKARDIRSPRCSAIDELDGRIDAQRREVSQLLTRFAEAHPDVLAAKARLAGTEAMRAAELARAAAEGNTCQRERLF